MLGGRTRLLLQRVATDSTGLDRLLRHTAAHAERFQLPELYKVGVLLKDPSNTLGLRTHDALLSSLAARYQQLRSDATPFQTSLLDEVLPDTGLKDAAQDAAAQPAEASATLTTAKAGSPAPSLSTTPQEYYKAIMDIMHEVEVEHGRAAANKAAATSTKQPSPQRSSSGQEGRRRNGRPQRSTKLQPPETATSPSQASSRADTSLSLPTLGESLGSSRAASLEGHLNALEPHLRELSPAETIRLIKALAKLNYTNYGHAVVLTRRGCEVAAQLQRHDLCQLFFNLHKLHTRDSLVPVVNGILKHMPDLTMEEVYLLCQSLEKQASTSSASQRLLTPLIAQGVRQLPKAASAAYHRALLISMARYDVRQPAAVQCILRDWASRWKRSTSEKDVLVLFEAAATLSPPGTEPEGLKELIECLTSLAATMSVSCIDRAMDLMSTVPMELSHDCMTTLLKRLEDEAGRLSVAQLKFILHLLSTYPPARGQVAVVSLAYAGAVRARGMDAETLEDIVISLAMLRLFTDDFFSIAHVLQTQKGGIRTFAQAQTLLGCCTAEMAATPRGLGMLTSVICTLAPVLNDEELFACRRSFVKLGVNDRDVLQRIFTKAKQSQRVQSGSSSRKRRGGHYDPMSELL